MYEEDLTEKIIGATIEVHREIGPGLLESAYQVCLERELALQGIAFEPQKPLMVKYKDIQLDCGYRLDLVVEGKVIIELKAVDDLHAIHEAQLMTYLRLSGCRVGLLINFNVTQLTKGIKRRVL